MNRRTFLTRSGLALGALIVGDEALEQLARLTHVRKTFPSAGVGRAFSPTYIVNGTDFDGRPFRATSTDGVTWESSSRDYDISSTRYGEKVWISFGSRRPNLHTVTWGGA
jgi:hypothetical protein